MILGFFGFFIGIIGMLFLSPKVTDYSIKLGKIFSISPIIIGLMIAVGANLPELSNSIVSSLMGFDDINIGNLLGSSLALFTINTGAVILLKGGFKVDRKNILILFACSTIVLFQIFTIFENNIISRFNGLILIGVFVIIYFIIQNTVIKKDYLVDSQEKIIFSSYKNKYLFFLILNLLGIVFFAYIFVNSIISLSDFFGVSAFIVSFFIVSIATTLPEFFIGINAFKRNEHELFLGDQFGGIISNLTLILGISALISEKIIDSVLIINSLNYILISFILVFTIMIIKKDIDRKMAIMLIGIYCVSIFFIIP